MCKHHPNAIATNQHTILKPTKFSKGGGKDAYCWWFGAEKKLPAELLNKCKLLGPGNSYHIIYRVAMERSGLT